jgi:uncharacterized protein YbgA (DUF1722 family)/uncharacterized protein YbbK (DUF523 family)
MTIPLMTSKLRLGISACLLGEKVRYDGGHKLDHYLRDTLGPFVEWVSVCPEVECGLPVPREAMRLAGDPDAPRLVTQRTKIDHTERLLDWARRRVAELTKENLSGFIFKSRSPSSGLRDAKVYNEDGNPVRRGPGLFARAFMARFPLVPVEDEGRLHDPGLRENFIERVFVHHRWQACRRKDGTRRGLVEFHTRHKLLLMAHSPKLLAELGRLVAGAKTPDFKGLLDAYGEKLLAGLQQLATVRKNVNVLQHIAGYFKRTLSAGEKVELGEVIDRYHRGLVPLVVPVTLVQHYVRKYGEPYLRGQVYLDPHPVERMLRSHV